MKHRTVMIISTWEKRKWERMWWLPVYLILWGNIIRIMRVCFIHSRQSLHILLHISCSWWFLVALAWCLSFVCYPHAFHRRVSYARSAQFSLSCIYVASSLNLLRKQPSLFLVSMCVSLMSLRRVNPPLSVSFSRCRISMTNQTFLIPVDWFEVLQLTRQVTNKTLVIHSSSLGKSLSSQLLYVLALSLFFPSIFLPFYVLHFGLLRLSTPWRSDLGWI